MNSKFKDNLAKKAVVEIEKLCRLHGVSISNMPTIEKSLLLNCFMAGSQLTISTLKEVQNGE